MVAEACAARLALLMAREMKWSHIHLEGDCLHVINALNDRYDDCLHSFGVVVSACVSFTPSFIAFHASFIRRVDNCLAHAFAHFFLSGSYVLDGFSTPTDLAHLI